MFTKFNKWTKGLSAALLGATIYLGSGIATTTVAADVPTTDAQEATLTEVIVTGSRIAAPNEVSTSPIQVLSSQYIETSGKSDVGDLLAQLPQNFFNAQGQDLGNATSALSTPGGVATADLRGLGPNRTLVLVDGRRLGQGSPNTAIQSPAPDLDQIPAGLVERVEVVTGGASAAYGSDAIAGVVNFILKKNFQGFQVDGEYGGYLHDNGDTGVQALVRDFDNTVPATGTKFDGKKGNLDMLMGTNFDDGNGNVTAFFGYRHQNAVPSSARDYGGCQLNPTTDANGTVNGVACGGSSNSNYFQPFTGPNAGSIYSVNGTLLVPRGSVATTPPASFNSQPYIDITRNDDRYNAAFMGHDEITDYFVPYAEFYFMDDRTHTVVAPAALFRSSNPTDLFGANAYATNCNNPLLSTQEAGILCSPAQITYAAANPTQPCVVTAGVSPNCVNFDLGRRNVEGGARLFDFEHENYRGVFGFKGDILGSKSWDYDVYGQYYYTTDFNAANKFMNFQAADNALQVTGTAAAPTCIAGASAGCVPYNIWSSGGVTQQQLAYLYLLGTAQGSSTLRTVHAEVTGKLGDYGIRSPVANDGLAVNVGFEHRSDNERYQPDSAEESGLLSGFGGAAAAIDNTVSVSEEFLELRAPLIQNMTGVKELLFDGGYRRSDYSTSGLTNTYKFEVQYAPINDYRLRVSYDKAIRAPSVIELFNPQIVETVALGNDPCAPTFNSNGTLAAPAVYTQAQCAHLHVSAAQYGNGGTTDTIPQGASGQLSELAGGNPLLQPEQAETYTIGVNFAPSQVPNLNGSIDYWHIELGGEVGVIPSAVIESQCANSGSPLYCSLVVRNPVSGSLSGANIAGGGYIVQTNVNAGSTVASGIDLQLNYKHDLPAGLGALAFEMNGSYLQHSELTPLPGQPTYECAGLYGHTCQTFTPRWQHILRTTWISPWKMTATITWHYFGKVEDDNNQSDPTLHYSFYGAYDAFNAVIPAYNYLDLETTWHVNKALTLRAGVNNVADKDPPIINGQLAGPSGYANSLPPYDLLGRELFVGFTVKL